MWLRVWIFVSVISSAILASSDQFNEETELDSFLIFQSLKNRELNGDLTRATKISDLEGPYWWNDSYVGENLECDEAAKYCLTVERIVYEPTGKCYELGNNKPCGSDGKVLVLDAEAFNNGKLRSICLKNDNCNKDELPMGSSEICHKLADILLNLCPYTHGVSIHPFGEFRCEYPTELYSDPVRVIQPRALGRCILPSLRRKLYGPLVVECSTEEASCLEKGKLLFRNHCYSVLSSDPCAEGQWLVLDDREAKEGRLRVSCKSAQPCGPGAHLLHVDGTCHSEKELRDILCPGEFIKYYVNGDAFCTKKNKLPDISGYKYVYGMCILKLN